MNDFLRKIIISVRKIERLIIVAIFLIMIAIFSFGILVRELPSDIANNFSWIEEVVRIMNIFLVFMTLGIALEKGKHVNVPLLLEKLGGKWLWGLTKVIDIVGLIFTSYLFFVSVKLMVLVFHSGQSSPTLNISMGVIYLAPTIGFALISLRYFFSLIGLFDRFMLNN